MTNTENMRDDTTGGAHPHTVSPERSFPAPQLICYWSECQRLTLACTEERPRRGAKGWVLDLGGEGMDDDMGCR